MQKLNGIWQVKITTGPLWFRGLNLLGDCKHIKDGKGYNVAILRWGHFDIVDKDPLFQLVYRDCPIVDEIRFNGADTIFGKFYLKGEYVGNFEMLRINKSG